MIIIFIMMMVGYVLYKKEILKEGASATISAIVINVCNPALLISSSFNRDTSVTNDKVILAVIAGAVLFGVLIIASFVVPAILHVDSKVKNYYALMCIFGNTGFIGIPLIQAVLGSGALIYAVIVNIYYTLIFYSYGYYLAGGENSKFSPKKLINIGNISLIVAVIIFLWQPKIPTLIENTVTYMANATTFLAITVIGISLARTNLKPIFTQIKLYLFVILRFILVPIVLSLVLRLFIKDEMLYRTMVILSAVPVGNLPLMRVEEVGGDSTCLSQGIILSTIMAIITIPIITIFM
jgi:predicted permease